MEEAERKTERFAPKGISFVAWQAAKSLGLIFVLLVMAISLQGCGKKKGEPGWSPHYRKAVQAYRKGDYARAVALFEKALVFDPSNAEIYLDIAAIHDDFLNNAKDAASNYERYVELVKGGEKAEWAKRWAADARRRHLSAADQGKTADSEAETDADKDKAIEELREQLRTLNLALAEERKESAGLADEVSTLSRQLTAARREKEVLEQKVASYAAGSPEVKEVEAPGHLRPGDREASTQGAGGVPVSWLLCGALGILVVALVVGQRCARAREKTLLASIQAAASGSTEQIKKDDILGKYYWVENDHSAGILSFSEKDGEIHACAIDGTTRLRSRGKGKLVGNVLTAELSAAGGEGVVTKFIFANKGRTVTAVWQGEEGTCVAAGTKAVGE